MPRGWVPRDAGTYVNLDDDALVIMTEWSGDDRATMAGGIVPLGRRDACAGKGPEVGRDAPPLVRAATVSRDPDFE